MADASSIIGGARVLTLIVVLGIATRLDLINRRVPNNIWIAWAKPAIFLMALDLLVRDANWMIWLTTSGVVALASVSVIGHPSLNDLKNRHWPDMLVSFWYACGLVGFIVGAVTYGPIILSSPWILTPDPNLFDPDVEQIAAKLWFRSVGIGLVVLGLDIAWRTRLLYGGADAKGLMLIAILIPDWSGVPVFSSMDPNAPPVFAVFIWGGVAMLSIPFLISIRNIRDPRGRNVRMMWHARPLEFKNFNSARMWLLDEVSSGPNGERRIHTRMRPLRQRNNAEKLDQTIAELSEMGRDWGWVTSKLPLMAYLFAGSFALLLLGDPIAWVIHGLESMNILQF